MASGTQASSWDRAVPLIEKAQRKRPSVWSMASFRTAFIGR